MSTLSVSPFPFFYDKKRTTSNKIILKEGSTKLINEHHLEKEI